MIRLLLISVCLLSVLALNACGQVDISLVEDDQEPTVTLGPTQNTGLPGGDNPAVGLDTRQSAGDDPGEEQATPAPGVDASIQPPPGKELIGVESPEEAAKGALTPAPTIVIKTQQSPCLIQTDWPTYRVRNGDTLGRIATWTGTGIDALIQANCLFDPDLLKVGQVLRVPRPVPENPPPTPRPTPTPSPTPVPWITYADPVYQVFFGYPENWKDAGEPSRIKFAGNDGFVQLEGLGAPYDIDVVASDQANHILLPYGSSPTIEPSTLGDGRETRFIFPSADQPPDMNNQALLIAPFADPIRLDGSGQTRINYLALAADVNHIRRIAVTLVMPPWPDDIGINLFTVTADILPGGGRQVTFSWDSYGATRGIVVSGTAERFAPWWPVEASGGLTVDLDSTNFPDPKMTLQVFNDVTGREASHVVPLIWPCAYDYFFTPKPERCPREAALITNGAFQDFEGGFMIWLPRPGTSFPSIYVFENDGRVTHYPDTWTDGDQESGSGTVPEGRFQPERGFGKVWRENPAVREVLGWGLAPEEYYQVSYQGEYRESIPGVDYLTRPDGLLLQLVDTSWQAFGKPNQDMLGMTG